MNLSELKEYHKNPRKMSGERFDKLSLSLSQLGDLGGMVVDVNTKEIIGGNQRMKSFLQRGGFEIEIIKQYDTPREDGTIVYGHLVVNKDQTSEQKFFYREVSWDEATCARANIVANKLTGMWDFDMLANSFNMDDLLDFGFSKPELDLLPKKELSGMGNDDLANFWIPI